MDILGLEPIMAAIVITVIGVGIQVGLGVLQSSNPFDVRKLVSSAIISVFTSFAIVVPILTALPSDIDSLTQFSVLIGTIAAIAGIDQLVKNTGGAILKKKK
jgi:hypothetical protein